MEFPSHSPGRKLRQNRGFFISFSKVSFNSLLIKVCFFQGCVCTETRKLEYGMQTFCETFLWKESMEKVILQLAELKGVIFF